MSKIKKYRRIKIGVLLLGFCMVCIVFAKTQMIDSSIYQTYRFIRTDLNRIENDSISLAAIYEKLYQLEQTKKGRVNIVHIGDSHIQADDLSGTIRQGLQLKFGNAGRGLIFPYKAAKSNEPSSYSTITNRIWTYKRNVFVEKPLPIGICGFTIESNDPTAEIFLTVKDQPRLGYGFTKFSLFHEKGSSNFDVSVCDNKNCILGVATSNTSKDSFVSELYFDKIIHQVYIRSKENNAVQKQIRIYGFLVENDSAGILYHTIGVNGAEYRHYNSSRYFFKQFSYLKADLVIVSLGTNEVFCSDFNPDTFYKNIDTLVTSIKKYAPKACIILSTPSDSYKRSQKGRIKNPLVKQAQQIIISYSLKNNVAYWDLLEVMGGYGSMAKWYAAHLTAKDYVHFTTKGYQVQGDLFYQAFIEGYTNYTKKKK